jgi:sucrose phosphorylase
MNVALPSVIQPAATPPSRGDAEIVASIRERLRRLYPEDVAGQLGDELILLAACYRGRIAPAAGGWSQRDAFLITYGDTIKDSGCAPLEALRRFLRAHVGPAISLVHLLPHFPFSSDDGFSVIDYRKVREDLGDWDDIGALANDYRLVFDAVVNHASQHSEYVKGHCSSSLAAVSR